MKVEKISEIASFPSDKNLRLAVPVLCVRPYLLSPPSDCTQVLSFFDVMLTRPVLIPTGRNSQQEAYGDRTRGFLKGSTLSDMRGAFVVRLGEGTEPARGRFEGSAEEVDTGKRLNFRSAEELLRFLEQAFEGALQRERERELNQRKEQQDDG